MLWLPLVCLLLFRAIRLRSPRGALIAGIVLGVSLLASPIQVYAYICIGVILLFAVSALVFGRKEGGVGIYLGFGAAALTVGLLISAVQVLPTLQLMLLSNRLSQGLAVGSAQHTRSPSEMLRAIAALALFVFPNLGGRLKDSMWVAGPMLGVSTHWQGYIGIVPFFLASLVSFAAKGTRKVPFLVTALLVLIIVIFTPLVVILYDRFLLIYISCASVLAAIGLDALRKMTLDQHWAHVVVGSLQLIVVMVFVAIVAGNLLLWLRGGQVWMLVQDRVESSLGSEYLGSGDA